MEEFKCGIDYDLSKPIVTGHGTAVIFSGWCFHEKYTIKDIKIITGKRIFKAQSINNARFDVLEHQVNNGSTSPKSLNSGFWAVVNFEGVQQEAKEDVLLKILLQNNEEVVVNLGRITLLPYSFKDQYIETKRSVSNEVTICMATYNPNIDLFKKQINSIINQSYQNWICIINDDCSIMSLYDEMNEIIKKDKRFIIRRNETNLGFYRNFEQCLSYVSKDTKYVALSDQDDLWYENKLEACLNAFDENTSLVYSDMKIVTENGQVLSNTYWENRKNHYKNLEPLILANTITGAASVFKSSLLEKILPFPERVGDSYHDWWVGLCSYMDGNIKYINEPLYDYVQHSLNIIGQSESISLLKKVSELLKDLKPNYKNESKRLIKEGKAIYEFDYKRILLTLNILYLRFNNSSNSKKIIIIEKMKNAQSVFLYIKMYIKGRLRGWDTIHSELRLAHGLISDKILRYFYKKRSKLHFENIVNNHTVEVQNNELTVDQLDQKISPIKLKVSDYQKERINIVIPTIDFRYFFGGYLGKFNLALKLAKLGFSVRFVIIDYCDFKPDYWRQEIKKYSGLEDFFEYVEVEYIFDRTKELLVNSNDRFIASTWWTAYIVNDAAKKLNGKKFTYLIQEYEPLTFNHGAYFALADETYNFPHYALFSTEFLREYFKEQRLGVFKDENSQGENNSISFENAILSFEINKEKLEVKKRKKLLFYARPESHAARNMFELGVLSLKRAVESGCFDMAEWEFYGMGSVSNYNKIKITDKVKVKMLPKMSLDEYNETLKGFDLGLSLMYTPHPSLVPLEMAAAGMLVVTNSYSNKTKNKMRDISTNLIVGEPSISDITKKIEFAVNNVEDIEMRLKGSKVNWSSDWDHTFNNEIMNKLNLFFSKNK